MFILAIVTLQQQALEFARRLLKPNGYFLCKLFQGQEKFHEMRSLLESLFRAVHLIKPSASREQSPEIYLLGLKYFGNESVNQPENEKNHNELERLLSEARRVRTKKKDK